MNGRRRRDTPSPTRVYLPHLLIREDSGGVHKDEMESDAPDAGASLKCVWLPGQFFSCRGDISVHDVKNVCVDYELVVRLYIFTLVWRRGRLDFFLLSKKCEHHGIATMLMVLIVL